MLDYHSLRQEWLKRELDIIVDGGGGLYESTGKTGFLTWFNRVFFGEYTDAWIHPDGRRFEMSAEQRRYFVPIEFVIFQDDLDRYRGLLQWRADRRRN